MKIYKHLRYVEKRSTVPLVGLCVYEAFALTFPNPHTPPITKLSKRHKWVFPVFCAAVGIHILCYEVADGTS